MTDNFYLEDLIRSVRRDTILERYLPLIPHRETLLCVMRERGIVFRDDVTDADLSEVEARCGAVIARLFGSLLHLYDFRREKLRELRPYEGTERYGELLDLLRLPGVRLLRAELYRNSGVTLRALSGMSTEEIRDAVRAYLAREGRGETVPLPKEVNCHRCVAAMILHAEANENNRLDNQELGQMDFLKTAADRYSVRKYRSTPVPEDCIEKILAAGRLAPTAHNSQPVTVTVIRSEDALARLDRCTECHYHAPLALLVCYDRRRAWVREYDGKCSGDIDAGIVTTHMMLEAEELGIGSTWIMYFDPEATRREFSLGDDLVPVAFLFLGYPDAGPSPAHSSRRALSEYVEYR